MKRLALAALGALIGVATPAMSQTPWVHVEVNDPGHDNDTRVKVNLPLSVVEIALDAAPSKIVSEGRIHLHHVDEDIDIEDLRRMWSELKAAGDAELVTVQSRDGDVDIRRDGDLVRINVTGHDNDKVQVEVPVAVVDALLSGEGQELDVTRAIRELKSRRGDIVRVDDGDTKVRIWIDEKD